MPALVLALPAAGDPATGPHRHVTITSRAGSTTLTVTSPEVGHDNLSRNWTEIPRPGQDEPFLRDAGGRLRTWKVSAVLYAQPPADVAADLQTLMFGHTKANDCVVAYGRLEADTCVIDALTVKTVNRVEGSNEPYWAELDITFKKRPADLKQIVPVPAPSASPAPAPSPPPPASKSYTVKAGDTLFVIAQRQYGHGDYWPRIATANKITDPRRIYPGQRLTIP